MGRSGIYSMICLTIMSREFFRLMASQQYDRQDLPTPFPPSSSSSGVAPVGKTMIKDKKEKVQRDVDMMSTTVGGTTLQGSTREFPEGESSDDGLDMLTHRSESTRLSSSRSCCTKSSGRKQRRLARFLEYNEKKAAAAGEKFEIVDADQRKEAQRAAMLHFTMSDSTAV